MDMLRAVMRYNPAVVCQLSLYNKAQADYSVMDYDASALTIQPSGQARDLLHILARGSPIQEKTFSMSAPRPESLTMPRHHIQHSRCGPAQWHCGTALP